MNRPFLVLNFAANIMLFYDISKFFLEKVSTNIKIKLKRAIFVIFRLKYLEISEKSIIFAAKKYN